MSFFPVERTTNRICLLTLPFGWLWMCKGRTILPMIFSFRIFWVTSSDRWSLLALRLTFIVILFSSYVLGAVYLQLCKLLSLEQHPFVQKPVDPSLFMHRFTGGNDLYLFLINLFTSLDSLLETFFYVYFYK